MNVPDPEECAAIVAALGIAFTASTRDAAMAAEPPRTTRWRRAGRLYGAVADERVRSTTFDEARRS